MNVGQITLAISITFGKLSYGKGYRLLASDAVQSQLCGWVNP